jgi:drug/metabolite transporter, DME family
MNENKLTRLYGLIAVIVAAFFWGTTGTAAAFAKSYSPIAMGAFAMGVGGIFQAVLASRKIYQQWRLILSEWRYLLIGVLAVAIYPLAFYSSMSLAGVAIGTLVAIGSAPLFSAVIEYYLEGLTLTRQWKYGAFLGVIGIILLIVSGNDEKQAASNTLLLIGIALGLVAGLTYALYSWTARKLMQKGVATGAAMGATFSLAGLLLIPLFIYTDRQHTHDSISNLMALYMALGPMLLGYLCYGYGLARIRASIAVTITLLEPVIATLLTITLLNEKLAGIGWLGILLIISCLIIITLPQKRRV